MRIIPNFNADFLNFRVFSVLILLFPLWVCGCAGLQKTRKGAETPAENLVERSIRQAGESISNDLAILSGSTQNRDFGHSSGSGDLYSRITLRWTGPIEGALSEVASKIGYKFEVEGKPPGTPAIVHVKLIDRPALSVIRDIGLQTGPGENLELDESLRLVRLTYTGGKKP
jgi:hypothetical protein